MSVVSLFGAGLGGDILPFAVVRTVGAQALPQADVVDFDSEVYDTPGWFGTNTSDIVVDEDGLYRTTFSLVGTPNSSLQMSMFYHQMVGSTAVARGAAQFTSSVTDYANGLGPPLSLLTGTAISVFAWYRDSALTAGSYLCVERLPDDLSYCISNKTAAQPIVAANVWQDVTYPQLAQGDGSWRNGDNVNYAVPVGVNRVRLAAGMIGGAGSSVYRHGAFKVLKNGAADAGLPTKSHRAGNGTFGVSSLLTPPLQVVEGDLFGAQVRAETTSSRDVQISSGTFFSIETVPSSIKAVLVENLVPISVNGSTWGVVPFAAIVYRDQVALFSTAAPTDFVVPTGCSRARFFGYLEHATLSTGTVRVMHYRDGVLLTEVARAKATQPPHAYYATSPWVEVEPGDVFQMEAIFGNTWDEADFVAAWAALECE